MARYAPGYAQPPSSDPASIYRNLREAVLNGDEHNADIQRQKTKLAAVALDSANNGGISLDTAKEIIGYIEATHVSDWKPLIYVIPYEGVAPRVLTVPRNERASAEMEYVIPDLECHEFEVIEPIPC